MTELITTRPTTEEPTLFATVRYRDGIEKAAKEDVAASLQLFDDRLRGLMPEGILDWIEANVYPEWQDEPIKLYPYQREPIVCQTLDGVVQEVITSFPEQFGKTTIYRTACMYKLVYTRGPKYVVYEEQKKAERINRRIVRPMILRIPELARQLQMPGKKPRAEGYDFARCSLDFTGAGSDFTSDNYRDIYLDEVDTWPLVLAKILAQIDNARKRRRIWRNDFEEGCLVINGSFKGTDNDSPMWHEYAGILDENQVRHGQSSMGLWHLLCLNCGETHEDVNALGLPCTVIDRGAIDSTQFDAVRDKTTNQLRGGLRWDLADGVVVHDSIRLLCPDCGHEHVEADSQEMNLHGAYVHAYDEITHRRGFVAGGLSGTHGLRWSEIAEKRMEVKASNEFELERTYHNSFRGVAMPTKSAVANERLEALLDHCMQPMPLEERPQLMTMVASGDTQESPWGWYWIVRGVDENFSTHLVACGFATSKAELEAAICTATYPDNRGGMKKVKWAIIDQGGTNAEDVKDMAKRWPHVWQYKGGAPSHLYQQSKSKDQVKLLLCDATRLHVKLLRDLYDQDDKSNNYWWLPPKAEVPKDEDPAFDYLCNVAAVRNLGKGKNSHLWQNWDCKEHERRDFFDCEKMLQVLLMKFKQQIQTMIKNKGEDKKLKLSDLQNKR